MPDAHTMESCQVLRSRHFDLKRSLSSRSKVNKFESSHFLIGNCRKGSACPFPHIKVDDNARVCINFQQGYCAKGDQCPLKHVKKELKSKLSKWTSSFIMISQAKVIQKDKLEYLRPFKSAADIEEEEAKAEIERSLQIGGWHSRFFTPGKKIIIFPNIKYAANFAFVLAPASIN